MSRWKKEYMATSHKVILAETLSPTFVGLTFQASPPLPFLHQHIPSKTEKSHMLSLVSPVQEVAEICYLRLNLVLVAMEARKYEGGQIWINPQGKKVTIELFHERLM